MAVLDENDRSGVWSSFQSTLSARRAALGLTKAELRAAVDAVDDWVDDNASSYNNALPVAARTALTAAQKAELLMFVVDRRFEVA